MQKAILAGVDGFVGKEALTVIAASLPELSTVTAAMRMRQLRGVSLVRLPVSLVE